MSNCPNCERYKKSAALWRNRAYELAGNPLPWKPDEVWVGLTDEEGAEIWADCHSITGKRLVTAKEIVKRIEAKLREKNGG